MVADPLDVVIGVDTHRDTHALAVLCSISGEILDQFSVPADPAGYRRAQRALERAGPGSRLWALEGCGSYGAGLARHLMRAGERVIEVDRPGRDRPRAKSDALDAVRAARTALSGVHPALPRAEGEREMLRVLMAARSGAVATRRRAICQIKGLVVSAPDRFREPLRHLSVAGLLSRCAALRPAAYADPAQRATAMALRGTAHRARAATAEARRYEQAIAALLGQMAPALLAEQGVGPIVAAQLLISWSHPGRVRSEAAFARLGGVAPIPASSGRVVRHRLDRGGDRQLNRALHTIVLVRRRIDPLTRDYLARRLAEGKSTREAMRCLKRFVARHLFRLLEAMPASA